MNKKMSIMAIALFFAGMINGMDTVKFGLDRAGQVANCLPSMYDTVMLVGCEHPKVVQTRQDLNKVVKSYTDQTTAIVDCYKLGQDRNTLRVKIEAINALENFTRSQSYVQFKKAEKALPILNDARVSLNYKKCVYSSVGAGLSALVLAFSRDIKVKLSAFAALGISLSLIGTFAEKANEDAERAVDLVRKSQSDQSQAVVSSDRESQSDQSQAAVDLLDFNQDNDENR